MIHVTYDPNSTLEGSCVPDGLIMTFINRLREQARASHRDLYITISSETLLLALRLVIARGELDYQGVEITYKPDPLKEGKLLVLNKLAQFVEWPEGFYSFSDSLLSELLDLQIGRSSVENSCGKN